MTMTTDETTSTSTPRVWVGCLACYNDGTLRGDWVDAAEAADFVPCEGREHEEWWCFDLEGFDGLLDGECSPMEAQRVAEVIDALDAWQPVAAFAAWCSNQGETPSAELVDAFGEQFRGEWESEEAFAQELAEDVGAIEHSDRWPNYCIDWERAARELFMDGCWSAPAPGGVYVFDSNA